MSYLNTVRNLRKQSLTNSSTDWMSFKLELESKIMFPIAINTVDDLENISENLIKLVQDSAWANTRQLNSKKYSKSYPDYILRKVREKRRARKRWQQSRDPADKNILNNLSKQLHKEIKKFNEHSLKNFLSNLSPEKDTNYSLWKVTKKKISSVTYRPPIKRNNGTWAKINSEKAAIFAEHRKYLNLIYAIVILLLKI